MTLTGLVTDWINKQSFADYLLEEARQLIEGHYDEIALGAGRL